MYIHLEVGSAPILITVPPDGRIKIPEAAVRYEICKRDLGTLRLALSCAGLLSTFDQKPTLLWQSLHRRHADANRYPDDEPYASGFESTYTTFHAELDNQVARILKMHAFCVHVDIHGCVSPIDCDIILGTQDHTTSLRGLDFALAAALRNCFSLVLGRNYRVGLDPVH